MLKIWLLIVLLFSMGSLLNGCVSNTLPKNLNESGLLIIPKTVKNDSIKPWARRYMLVVAKLEGGRLTEIDKVNIANNNENFQLVSNLSTGEYEFTRMTWAMSGGWRGTKAMDEGYKLSIPFSIVENKITILPFDIHLLQASNAMGISSSIHTSSLADKKKELIVKELKNQENSVSWGL